MSNSFGFPHFLWRWLFASVLVVGTYNPTSYSYVSWILASDQPWTPVIALVGIALLIGWIVYLRATFLSMGVLGIVLGSALFACVIWLFVDLGWLSLGSTTTISWIVLILMSILLAIGMSWSHIRRQLTGQIDTDNLEDGRG